MVRTEDGFERTFGVNHLGHFALVKLLMPALVASSSANTVSGLGLTHAAHATHNTHAAHTAHAAHATHTAHETVGEFCRSRVVITASSIHSSENPDGRAGRAATLGALEGVTRLSLIHI